jgi:hypothetical protein
LNPQASRFNRSGRQAVSGSDVSQGIPLAAFEVPEIAGEFARLTATGSR